MLSILVHEAQRPEHILAVQNLLRDYLLWMKRRFGDQPDILDPFFDPCEWQRELGDLVGHYGPPSGGIVLAMLNGVPAGCVLVRGIGDDVCEMKRLFVRPAFHRNGIARRMVGELLGIACKRGYTLVRLEAFLRQREAQAFYASLGFVATRAYHPIAPMLEQSVRFLAKSPCGASHSLHNEFADRAA